jgi:paraquat-inducible protein A
MDVNSLIACHECDLIHRVSSLPDGAVARCVRCGAVLYRQKRNPLDRTLALTIAGLILFVLANVYPVLSLKLRGQVQETTLITGIKELCFQDMWGLALLVCLTGVLAPLFQLAGMLYVLLPLRLNRTSYKLPLVFRSIQRLQPWGMLEVFMLGILVSIVKLAKMATIVPGVALYSFFALIFVLAASAASVDPHLIWERWEHRQ